MTPRGAPGGRRWVNGISIDEDEHRGCRGFNTHCLKWPVIAAAVSQSDTLLRATFGCAEAVDVDGRRL
ncbi:hypothetical protein ACPV4B_12015 [Vibrio parahaemolyticus]